MKSDLSCKMKCVAEFMADEIEDYNEYLEEAEKWEDVPVLNEMFIRMAKKHQESFQELYKLLNEYMTDLKEEMASVESKHTSNMPQAKSPMYGRRG